MLSKRILLTVVLGAVLVAPVAARSEDNKILVRRWYDEAWNKGDMAAVDDLLSPTYVGHAAGAPDVKGTEGIKQLVATFGTAFPDHRVTVEDIVAEGDKVAVRYTMRGTHRGEFMGVAPTNKADMDRHGHIPRDERKVSGVLAHDGRGPTARSGLSAGQTISL
jgi:steroid delta-isomerase-like uncharacterized protein